ncbi:MAG: hypothetical protein JNK74_07960 [Candidatus Hydrogenedentes bacterium]|nr:hypothetical protein [Candidatus Hydrogenedentota bacterium]
MVTRAKRRNLQNELSALLAWPMLEQMPRLLSQVDRNMHSPTYGCACRNHWHYRTEDIANSPMQELVLSLALAWKLEIPDNPYYRSPLLLDWIEAMLDFTMRIQRPNGSFDAVFRGRDAYAATALVTFHVSETILQLERHLSSGIRNDAKDMLNRAAQWLSRGGEAGPGHQIAGAAAAFMNLAALDPGLGCEEELERLLAHLEGLQSPEGWFPEEGGADIGCASLTYGFLALIAKRTGARRATALSARCAEFLQHFLHRDGTVGGVYGSRNTEYFIPLGAVLQARRSDAAARMVKHLEHHLDVGRHVLITRCVDDRHLARLSPFYLLSAQAAIEAGSGAPENPGPPPRATWFEEAGLWSVDTPGLKLVANLRKGGVFHLDLGGHAFVDCGYFAEVPDGPVVTTQFLQEKPDIAVDGLNARMSARLVVLRPVTAGPWKNLLARAFNLLTPPALRRPLTEFRRRRASAGVDSVGSVHRNIVISDEAVDVTDFIEVTEPVVRMILQLDTERAASFGATGFYQPQELNRDGGILPVDLEAGKVIVQRRYDGDGLTVFS